MQEDTSRDEQRPQDNNQPLCCHHPRERTHCFASLAGIDSSLLSHAYVTTFCSSTTHADKLSMHDWSVASSILSSRWYGRERGASDVEGKLRLTTAAGDLVPLFDACWRARDFDWQNVSPFHVRSSN